MFLLRRIPEEGLNAKYHTNMRDCLTRDTLINSGSERTVGGGMLNWELHDISEETAKRVGYIDWKGKAFHHTSCMYCTEVVYGFPYDPSVSIVREWFDSYDSALSHIDRIVDKESQELTPCRFERLAIHAFEYKTSFDQK